MSKAALLLHTDGSIAGADFADAARAQIIAKAQIAETRMAQVHTGAMTDVTNRYKDQLRADVVGGGFYAAVKLSKTWQARTFPSRAVSMEPAGYIFTNAQTIIDAFTLGATIIVRNGHFLAIPEGPAKAIVRQLNQARSRSRDSDGRFTDEAGTVQRVATALGVERLEAHVDERTGRGVLVAAGSKLTRTGRRANRQSGPDTVLFALVRQATLKQRIQGRVLLESFDATFGPDFEAAVAARSGAGEQP